MDGAESRFKSSSADEEVGGLLLCHLLCFSLYLVWFMYRFYMDYIQDTSEMSPSRPHPLGHGRAMTYTPDRRRSQCERCVLHRSARRATTERRDMAWAGNPTPLSHPLDMQIYMGRSLSFYKIFIFPVKACMQR